MASVVSLNRLDQDEVAAIAGYCKPLTIPGHDGVGDLTTLVKELQVK